MEKKLGKNIYRPAVMPSRSLKRIPHPLEDRIYQRPSEMEGKGYVDSLIRQGYTSGVQSVLDKHGGETITSLTIVRTPLAKALNVLMNVVSFGEYEKAKSKNGYDDYFHLNLNVTTDKGTKLVVEKNEVINVQVGHKLSAKSQVMNVSPVSPVTLQQLMDNAKKYLGKKYFVYNAKSNNCQVFVNGVLHGSNMGKSEYTQFVVQDTDSIFKNSPGFRKLANTVTDLASASTAVNDSVITKGVLGTMVPEIGLMSAPKSNDSKATKLRKHLIGFGDVTIAEPDFHKFKVAELKYIIKDRRKDFGHKVHVTGKTKAQLIALVEEIM